MELVNGFFSYGLLVSIPPWPAVSHAEREAATCYMEEALNKKKAGIKSSIEADIGRQGEACI